MANKRLKTYREPIKDERRLNEESEKPKTIETERVKRWRQRRKEEAVAHKWASFDGGAVPSTSTGITHSQSMQMDDSSTEDEDSSQQSTTRRNMDPHETSANSAEIEAELMNPDEIFNEFVDGDTDDEIVRDNMGPAIKDSDYAVLWQNASKHFDKTFYGNEFGHICDIVRDNMGPAIKDGIMQCCGKALRNTSTRHSTATNLEHIRDVCDRLWFKKDLNCRNRKFNSVLVREFPERNKQSFQNFDLCFIHYLTAPKTFHVKHLGLYRVQAVLVFSK
jgi:hypothetical protein